MKATPPNDPDSSLSDLLKEWKVDATLPPRFQERVWQRVALAETDSVEKRPVSWFRAWFATCLGQPGPAVGCVTLLLVAGFIIGWERGVEKSARVDRALSARYIERINPYQSTSQ